MEPWRRLIKKAKLDQALRHITDERYRRLIGTVLKKIPYAIWDNETTTIDIYLADTQPFGPGVYGTTGPIQITESSSDTQAWEICVYRKETDPLSDTDIMHVVAHELGHATSNTPCHYGEFLRVLSLRER